MKTAVVESIGATELARALGVLSAASELVGDLCQARIVERHEDPANRRRTFVRLAEPYRASVEQLVASRARR